MSTTLASTATARDAPAPRDGRSEPSRPGDTLSERLAAQRRDALRADASARERHRADFERALRRAGDETPACAPTTEPTATVPHAQRATTVAPSDSVPATGRDRRAAVDDTDRSTQRECAATSSVHVAAAMREPAAGRPSPSSPAPDAALAPRLPPATIDAAGRWRFEFGETGLPVRQLEVQRLPHGALEVTLPALRSSDAPLGVPLMRLRERMSEHGVTLASHDPASAESEHDLTASARDTLARHDRLPPR
ncbi:hypothetical protein [Piscinibacter sp.]|uniref:hypothetical protein n=1 Tax=Piscinibacter sp. TaxID=1903157 RepID=UPI002C80EA95|nr:hypothetical protein [Albitalea sp.]HUG22606.1 hypothetical protein [Albitalea sp.]